MVTKIYLVRHAQAEGNVKRFFQGRIDTDLSELGYKQIKYLAERFKDINFDKIYSSPYKRAMATAEAVNEYHNLEIIKDEKLVEIDGGKLEGMQWTEIDEKYPVESEKWKMQINDFQAPDGENLEDVFKRMGKAVTELAEENAGKTIVISSHGCAIRAFLCFAEFGDLSRIYDVGWADNTSVSYLEYENGKYKVIFKNDVSHLPDGLYTPTSAIWNSPQEYLEKMKGKK